MNILEQYVDRMNAHDAQGIADCWVDEGAVFDDEAAKLLTDTPAYLEGKEAILATFSAMCAAGPKATILKMASSSAVAPSRSRRTASSRSTPAGPAASNPYVH